MNGIFATYSVEAGYAAPKVKYHDIVCSNSEKARSEVCKDQAGKSKRRKRKKKITYDPHPVRNKLRKLYI